jgi:hypothetical protein
MAEGEKRRGTVEDHLIGGMYIVEGDTVYQFMTGGPHIPVGFVEDGVAYLRMGGPPKRIGLVKYDK